MEQEIYYSLSRFTKEKFGEKTTKIIIDGGFTCPNRDGTKGFGGCIYCSEKGSGDFTQSPSLNITTQINQGIMSSTSRRSGNKYIAYFQNFSGTYGSIESLNQKYAEAISHKDIVGLAIATRPDCINQQNVELIKKFSNHIYTWIELGLQTSNKTTGNFINLCYSISDFENAVRLLNENNIDIVVHLIVGLPGESQKDCIESAKYISSFPIKGVKIHSLYVVENTPLADLYKTGKYTPITFDEYTNTVSEMLGYIRDDIVIHRITGDAPKQNLLAPSWNTQKIEVINRIKEICKKKNIHQGCFYSK